jgi:putative glutamine amidotransferase
MAAALGGNVHQDIYAALGEGLLGHSQEEERGVATHMVNVERDSLLHTLFGETLAVNSFHHQAVKDVAPGFKVTAKSKDGIVEAIEKIDNPKVWGVQFHPEILVSGGNNDFIGIFKALLE